MLTSETIEATARAIAPHLRAGQLIVLESTTYPGTTEEVLVPILEAGNQRGLTAARTCRCVDRWVRVGALATAR